MSVLRKYCSNIGLRFNLLSLIMYASNSAEETALCVVFFTDVLQHIKEFLIIIHDGSDCMDQTGTFVIDVSRRIEVHTILIDQRLFVCNDLSLPDDIFFCCFLSR